MNKLKEFIFISLFVFFLVATFLLLQIFYRESQEEFLKVVFLGVGQGDAVFIETPNGFKTLIDAGPNSTVVRSISKFLPFYSRSVDLLIATHSDADHVAGFVDIINRFNIKSIGQNFVEDNDSLNSEINNLISEKNIDKYFLQTGDKIIIDPQENIYIEILWPEKTFKEKDNNDNSVITRIVYGDTEILLTGDASLDIEEKLIKGLDKEYLESDILKLGHHGSRTSTSLEFLKIVNPIYIVNSAGKDNRFGHPHQEVLDIVEDFRENQKILETSVLGSIEFQSDGEDVWLVE